MAESTEQKYPRTKKSFIESLLVGLLVSNIINVPFLINKQLFSKNPMNINQLEVNVITMIIISLLIGIMFFFSRIKPIEAKAR